VGVIRLLGRVVVAAVELLFWALHLIGRFVRALRDGLGAARSLRRGQLHCPRGHVVPMQGQARCTACEFVYNGSLLSCPNPECPVPTTAYLNCPECGLSVRNPFRWGRA